MDNIKRSWFMQWMFLVFFLTPLAGCLGATVKEESVLSSSVAAAAAIDSATGVAQAALEQQLINVDQATDIYKALRTANDTLAVAAQAFKVADAKTGYEKLTAVNMILAQVASRFQEWDVPWGGGD